ncbi:uncharacterized protein LOC143975814 isoform X1 [Lithobates pipiens]
MEMSRNGDNMKEEDLQDFFISRRKSSSFTRGKLLSIIDISSTLIAGKSQLNDGGRKMLRRLERVKLHHFQHTQFPFAVSNLQHVTDLFSMYEIYKQDGFKATEIQSRPELKDLSFWSASISLDDIDGGRQRALENVKGLLSPEMAIMYEEKISQQFASSSAFNRSASRYGNFKFSFPLSELLSLYQTAPWYGEPELRILGTDIYKTEIAHYILVHSPDATEFGDLPIVPSYDQNSCGPLPFVYRKMGSLYWRPESTASALKIKITEQGSVINECCLTCDFFITNGYCRHTEEGIYSVWNHLIFAFHLPGKLLKVPKHRLLQNLTTCNTEEPYLGKERLEPEAAGKIIQRLKDDFTMSRRQ